METDMLKLIDQAEALKKQEREGWLQEAIEKKNFAFMTVLLDRGVDVNAAGTGQYAGQSMLHVAASVGNGNGVFALLKKGAQIDAQSAAGATPLMLAAAHEDSLAAEILISGGANVKAADKKGNTALHYAADKGRVAACKVLLAAGADVKTRDGKENTALHYAANKGDLEACQTLIAAGAEVDVARSLHTADGSRPLHLAAHGGHAEVCRVLLEAGARWDRMNLNSTPLHLAAENGHLDACRVLMEHGADPDFMRDPDTGRHAHLSPCQKAVAKGREQVVEYLLLECNANHRLKSGSGETMEELANNNRTILRLLRALDTQTTVEDALVDATQAGGEPSVKKSKGLSPL